MTRHYSEYGFADLDNAKTYASGSPALFCPGYEVMQELTHQLILETTPKGGNVLVLGAGGGIELKRFAQLEPSWRFAAVDPSPEMLSVAKDALAEDADRVEWFETYIPDAPAGPFDSATCLLTLHLISDGGDKLEALKAIRNRLKPGGALAVVDNCYDKSSPDFKKWMDRFVQQARLKGAPEEMLGMVRQGNTEKGESVSPERESELFAEAGFTDVDLYYAALSWRGWIMRA